MRDGWQIKKLLDISARSTEKNSKKLDLVFTVSASKGLIKQENYFTKRVASNNLSNYYVVKPGEYVFNKSYSVEAPYGVIAKNKEMRPGLVSPLYIVFRAKDDFVDGDFFGLAMTSSIFWESLKENLKEGGRSHGALNLKVADFFNAVVPVPPLPEQKRIVDLISSVDSYIESLAIQLETGKSARNAILHELLSTPGPNWIETTLGEVAECSWGNTETTKSKYVESGYLAFSASGADGFLDWFEHDRTAVVLSAIGAQCGKTWFAEGKWTSIKNTIWLKSDNLNLLDKYLFYLSNTDQFWQIRGQAQPFISLGDVRAAKVILPPLPEQKRIVEIVSEFDSFIESAEKAIEEGKKLRSGLLSELLSGEHEIPASYDKVMSVA